jgi:CRP-like cAMP-binding protein
MIETELLKTLATCKLFADMSETEIDIALGDIDYKVVRYKKHDVYSLSGIPLRSADIIISGTLTAQMTALSGKSVNISTLTPGTFIAPAFLFATDNRMPVSVETNTTVVIFRMSKEAMLQLIDVNAKVRMNYIRLISDIDVFMSRKVRFHSLFSVKEKVAYFLKEKARQQQSSTIHLSRSRQEIADSFGIQKFSLLRVLSELVECGAIAVDGKTITILDATKM